VGIPFGREHCRRDVVHGPGMTAPRTATRLVYVRLIHPRTVRELDGPKLDLTLTKQNPKHYAQAPISYVPVS
jgi:hypothetical protein